MTSIRQLQYEALKKVIIERYPNTKIKYKCDNWFWKLLPGTPKGDGQDYKRSVVAQYIGNTIWMPDHKPRISILAHEYQHVYDKHKSGKTLFRIAYLSPQIIALILSLIVLLLYFLKIMPLFPIIAALIFLLPLPAIIRATLEARGYAVNVAVFCWLGKECSISKMSEKLTKWLYYKMIWRKSSAEKLLKEVTGDLNEIQYTNHVFMDLYKILKVNTY